MATVTEIPLVDLSQYGLGGDTDEKAIASLADKIHVAFRDIGFCYISNHGVPQSQIDQVYAVSKTFFEKSDEFKTKFQRPYTNEIFHGWINLERELLNPDKPGDYKEAFNFLPGENVVAWPDVPEFEVIMKTFYDSCHALTLKLLDLIAIGLKLENTNFLRECHSLIGQKGSSTAIRTLYYPPLPSDREKLNQMSCGEHSDYGCITLLFQDNIGGLEVQNRQGEYVPANPIPGTVLINIGDLLQRWASDKIVSTKHRVRVTEKVKCRQSVAFFVQPDNDVVIKSLDNSDKYKPITSLDYLQERFAATY